MTHRIGDDSPAIDPEAFIAWNAEVAGAATIAKDASIWFGTTVRADVATISIGARSNLQDGVVVHVDPDAPTVVGEDVTVGHGAIVHGCRLGDGCLVGMGAILLSHSEFGPGCIIGAGSLVTQGKKFPARSLVMGSPAKFVREVSDDEFARNLENARRYVARSKSASDSGCDRPS